jgi:hypothetical protein
MLKSGNSSGLKQYASIEYPQKRPDYPPLSEGLSKNFSLPASRLCRKQTVKNEKSLDVPGCVH